MIKLKDEGFEEEGKAKINGEDTSSKLTFEEVTAQSFVFFIAAFETTSSTIALCLHELSKNQLIQQKVQQEIDNAFEKRDNKDVTYDLMTELKFLECCIDETLRIYPPAPFLIRECTKTYRIPACTSNLVIEKGTPVIISNFGLHRDSDIFENPLEFRPERFLKSSNGEGKANGLFYLPFGDGPRICIGMRFGKMSAKLGLMILLAKFRFEFVEAPQGELKFSPKQFVLTLKDDIHLKVTLRDNK